MKPIKIEVPLNEENEENSIDIDMPEVEIEKEDIEIDFQNHTVNQKLVPWPKGDDGLTPTDEQLIALIEPRIPKLKQPKDWKTPTRTEIKEIIKEVLPEDKLIEKIVKKVPRIKGDKWDKGDTLRFADLTAYEKQILTWPQGSNGIGVPRGGADGQILAKSSSRDFDTEWIDNSGWGGAVDSVNWQTWVVVLDQDDIGDGTTYKQYSQTEKTKLAGIETGAEVNTIDTVSDTTEIDLAITARDLTATLKNGSIDESKLDTSVNTSLDLADTAVQPAALSSYQLLSEKDQTNGYAGLDWSGKINSAQIPDIALSQFLGNFTDTTAALANAWVQASQIGDWFTVDTSGGQSWIVTTSLPTTLSDITQLKTPTGAVTSVFSRTGTVTAQNGDYTASNITNVPAGNIAATDVQAALNELDGDKQATLVSGTNIKTVNSTTLLGSGDIAVATTAQGALADSALQPWDIASWTITARADDINFSGGIDGDVLTVQADGSLALEAAAGGGANTALSNLASVAINTSLISDTTNTDDLGSSSILWRHTYTTDVELWHASDTTLSRVSAGVVAVEGKTLANLTDGGTFAADISVPDEAYGVGWNGSVEVPTKNAIYDKIETLTSPTALTLMPLPNHPISDATNGTTLSRQMNVNTTAWLWQIVVPFGITVNKITFRTGNNAVAGTVKIALYSEDGQTKKFEVTSWTTSANVFMTTAVSAVALTAWVYYVVIIPQSTCDVNILCWRQPATPSWLDSVASEPVIGGTITVTADTMPTTFTPSSITAAANDIAVIRLDN